MGISTLSLPVQWIQITKRTKRISEILKNIENTNEYFFKTEVFFRNLNLM